MFQEFSFLLAETVPPRTLQPDVYTEFERLYLQTLKEYQASSPYKYRLTSVDDVADIAEFFASDLAGFVSGQHLLVNGGSKY